MLKGLFIARAGMLPRQYQLDVIANNLANMNTVGYKKDKLFYRRLVDAMEPAKNDPDQINRIDEITDFSTGNIRQTGNPLDLAIVGDGFFMIQTPDGDVFTRNGNFTLDPNGRLVTQDGYAVMGSGGEIQLAGNDFRITEDGKIMVNDEVVDSLRIVKFEDTTLLKKIGSSYFMDEDEAGMVDVSPDQIQVRQGFLEGSNVSGIEEMTQMINLYRQFELGEKTITTQDRTLDKLINEAGRPV